MTVTRWFLVGVVATGAAVGVGVGAATGGTDSVEVAAAVSFYGCPDGSPLGDLRGGDRVLATGRDATGDWLEIRSPHNRGARVWVEARFITADASTDALDEKSCDERGELALAPVTETTTTTVPPSESGVPS